MAKKEKKSELEFEEKMTLNGKLIRLIIVVVCVGLLTAVYMMIQPQDLSDIDGYGKSENPSRDLNEVLTKAVEGNYSVTLTEAEINHMLQTKLVSKQGGLLGEVVDLKGVYIRLREDLAEVIIVREVFGHELTTSMYLQIEQIEKESGISTKVHLHGSKIGTSSPLPKLGGRFGKLKVPQGFLVTVVPDYVKIAEALESEIKLGFEQMARFEIQDKRLMLDPRSPTRHVGGDEIPF